MPTDRANDGKCPACGKLITNVKIEKVSATLGICETEYQAISFYCEKCRTVLSVQVDPSVLKSVSQQGD